LEDATNGARQPAEGILKMIKLKGIFKSYGSIKVLEDFSLDIDAGSSVCLVGRSGCGKSTLLKVIALIARPDRGNVIIDGKRIKELNEAELEEIRKNKIAYSFQEPLLIPHMSALENLTEIIGAQRERAIEVLSQLGLSDRLNHRPAKLSAGEKKRVDIARAVLKGASLLIADEPLSNLDPSTGVEVMELLRAHSQNKGTVVYSSVEPSDARFADIMINMSNKRC
jgi:ABC-type lipoprotein export system ATPase subunit